MPRDQSWEKKRENILDVTVLSFKHESERCDRIKPSYLLHADFSVSSSGETYCAVPTNELALAAKTRINILNNVPLFKHKHLERLKAVKGSKTFGSKSLHSNREHIQQVLESYLVYFLMITVLPFQNLLFGCACLHSEEYFQVSGLWKFGTMFQHS